MGALKPWHIVVLVVLLLLLFGAKRLPDAARGLGRSLRIFKSETKDLISEPGPGDNETRPTRPAAVENADAPDVVIGAGDPVAESRMTGSRGER
ncbi:MAG TPA: Sec-independent protein translocase subunit TatA [Cryptosporangiaceae bacterium]|nr:Sec-independent protein translocase subunit TatA [Cryptosporangiaceae bacterium]